MSQHPKESSFFILDTPTESPTDFFFKASSLALYSFHPGHHVINKALGARMYRSIPSAWEIKIITSQADI